MDPKMDVEGKETDFGASGAQCITLKFAPEIAQQVAPSNKRIFSVFSYGVVYETIDSSSMSLDDYRKVAATFVYNIALSYHVIGLQGAARVRDLEKALMAYKVARNLLNALEEDTLGFTGDVYLLALAIVNNQGHAHEQLFNIDRTKSCLEELHMLLPHTPWSEQTAKFHLTGLLFPPGGELCPRAPAA